MDKTSCAHARSMQPGVKPPLFSTRLLLRENLPDSPSIWVKHLCAGVCPGGCLVSYAAWNGYGKKGSRYGTVVRLSQAEEETELLEPAA